MEKKELKIGMIREAVRKLKEIEAKRICVSCRKRKPVYVVFRGADVSCIELCEACSE